MIDTNSPVCERILTYRPPRIAMGLLLAAAALEFALPAGWPRLPAWPVLATALGALGLAIMLRAWWLFRTRDNAICPTAATRLLITDDIYRLTRHPMYLGIVMMLVAVALYAGGIFYYVAAVVFFFVIDFAFCPYEEQKLDALFPTEFTAYRTSVRRWL